MSPTIPERLAKNCRRTPEGRAWLAALPDVLRDLAARWSLELGAPFDSLDVTASWVAPVRRRDGRDAVLKVGMPHMEAEHEAHGLRFWRGDPTVELLDADEHANALLLERCRPGTALRHEADSRPDETIARLLRRLWRTTTPSAPFRPIATMLAAWSAETLDQERAWPDTGMVRLGLALFEELSTDEVEPALLATDLHAGNVLRAEREPWLVIDPKPFVGDPAYDATQHLLNSIRRLRADPEDLLARFSDMLGVEAERVRLWTFARAAAEPRDVWEGDERWELAKILAP